MPKFNLGETKELNMKKTLLKSNFIPIGELTKTLPTFHITYAKICCHCLSQAYLTYSGWAPENS